MELSGPAVIEERESTTVLPPGCVARVDDYATLLVKVEPGT
jgi:N-methylhydantoinase A/oxoprolinase/acetone carboxylase beta subunit